MLHTGLRLLTILEKTAAINRHIARFPPRVVVKTNSSITVLDSHTLFQCYLHQGLWPGCE